MLVNVSKVGAGKGTVREHITVKVIAYGVAVERDQTVVGVILEVAVRCGGYVTRRVITERFGGNDRVIAELLDSSRSHSAETIISITHFGRICKYFHQKHPHSVGVKSIANSNIRIAINLFLLGLELCFHCFLLGK